MKRIAISTAALMVADHAALRKKIAEQGLPRMKEAPPSLEDIKAVQDKLLTGFEAFKAKNDERLKQLEEKGTADVVTRDELAKVEASVQEMRSMRDELDKLAKRAARPGGDGSEGGRLITPEQKEHADAFVTFLRNRQDMSARQALIEIEKKAVATTTDAGGGYAVPETIAAQIQRELSEVSPLRNIVGVVQAGTPDYKELVDVRGAAYGWRGETGAVNETNTPQLAEVAPTFGMLYAYPQASEESLDDMFFDVEAWLVASIVEAFAEGEENAIVNGTGTNMPTGFLAGPTPTAQADGTRAFGTLQFVASGAAAAVGDADKFIDMIQSLKAGYRRRSRFVMNKGTTGTVMKLKDGDGNYLWKMGDIESGQPDRLLGYPITESEEMPDIAADAFPIAFGDFQSGYLLAPLVGIRVTRDEVTGPGYVKWYIRRRLGGKIRKSEAIKLLKVAA
jgi:HK97 family phage major capsid protein